MLQPIQHAMHRSNAIPVLSTSVQRSTVWYPNWSSHRVWNNWQTAIRRWVAHLNISGGIDCCRLVSQRPRRDVDKFRDNSEGWRKFVWATFVVIFVSASKSRPQWKQKEILKNSNALRAFFQLLLYIRPRVLLQFRVHDICLQKYVLHFFASK
jgi:hypothetical protein